MSMQTKRAMAKTQAITAGITSPNSANVSMGGGEGQTGRTPRQNSRFFQLVKQDIKELKLLRKGDLKGRYSPILIEKGPDKMSLKRSISDTVEPIGVTLNHRSLFTLEKIEKGTEAFLYYATNFSC